MAQKINSAGVLYHRKSPPTYDMLKARFFKNWQTHVDKCEDARKEFDTEAEWRDFLSHCDALESYDEAKAILKRRGAA